MQAEDHQFIENFFQYPRESLNIEMKDWLELSKKAHIAKIVKTSLALYNSNGGWMFIGFDDDLSVSKNTRPSTIDSDFHPDNIMSILGRYTSSPFSIDVYLYEFEDNIFPIMKIPSGVRRPVVARSPIESDGKVLVRADTVYIRTVSQNGVPSSSVAGWRDWENLSENISRNRHDDFRIMLFSILKGINLSAVMNVSSNDKDEVKIESFFADCQDRYIQEVRDFYEEESLDFGCFEIAGEINGGNLNYRADLDFFRLVQSANPNLTGWPLWIDTYGHHRERDRPKVSRNAWQASIFTPINQGFGWSSHHDFWVIDPRGLFYHRRALQDDLGGDELKRRRLEVIDPFLSAWRVAEGLLCLQSFAKTLCQDGNVNIIVKVRWTKLKGRILNAWANPLRRIYSYGKSHDNDAEASIKFTAQGDIIEISNALKELMEPLTILFDGKTFDQEIYMSVIEEVKGARN